MASSTRTTGLLADQMCGSVDDVVGSAGTHLGAPGPRWPAIGRRLLRPLRIASRRLVGQGCGTIKSSVNADFARPRRGCQPPKSSGQEPRRGSVAAVCAAPAGRAAWRRRPAALSGPDGQVRPGGAASGGRRAPTCGCCPELVLTVDGAEPVPVRRARCRAAARARLRRGAARLSVTRSADPTVRLERTRRARGGRPPRRPSGW